ncbi:MAG: hypothetical protein BMS9Abin22_419 [Gammaproteobacteria bacterium]|nr:MAG: hypothetical protein BMS9Abin22_419 [Gammaproteobacteria bacterium]
MCTGFQAKTPLVMAKNLYCCQPPRRQEKKNVYSLTYSRCLGGSRGTEFLLEKMDILPAGDKRGIIHDLLVQRDIGFDAVHDHF